MKQTSAHVLVSCKKLFIIVTRIKPYIFSSNMSSAENIPAGYAQFVNQSVSSVEFEILQPTRPLPPYLSINFCNGTFNITIISASAKKNNTIQQMWNMCEFGDGQALISLHVDSFPMPTHETNYTVLFNIPFHFDGVVNFCYLQLEADNITVSDQGEWNNLVLIFVCRSAVAIGSSANAWYDSLD